MMDRTALYRTIWRWHFYAGLFVMPLVLILAVTGALYLFKPQIDRWEERAWQGLPTSGAASANVQLDAALASYPGAQFNSYRLPEQSGDAAMIHLAMADGRTMRDVFVSPQGKVIGSLNPDRRVEAVVQSIHGQLLLGTRGSWIVELAASWAIVMIISGLYLWWPAGRGMAGVIWPRIGKGTRLLLRDLHAVTGFWVAGLALVLLLTGLPWTDVWGSGFKWVRAEMGWVKDKQDWTIGGKLHAEHDHAAMMTMQASGTALVSLADMVAKANATPLPFPVLISPPGGTASDMAWTIKSDTPNRPLRVSLRYDMATGKLLSRTDFADKHPVDQVIGYGIAWHEGQLFGWPNQLIGLLTALMLVTMAVTGFILWRKRKPASQLGAPPVPPHPAKLCIVAVFVLLLAMLLPMLAASLIMLWLAEKFILSRIPVVARWLGLGVS